MVCWELRDWLGAGDSQSWNDTVFSVCCTQCKLYLVYAALSCNSWLRHGAIERDDLTSDTSVMVMLRRRMKVTSGSGANYSEQLGLKRILCASQFAIPDRAGMSFDPAGNNTNMRSSKLNQAWLTPDFSYPLVSPIWFSFSSPISLFRPQLYHHRKNTNWNHSSESLYSMIMSWHRVQHIPNAAYTEYSVHPRLFVFPSVSWWKVDPWM